MFGTWRGCLFRVLWIWCRCNDYIHHSCCRSQHWISSNSLLYWLNIQMSSNLFESSEFLLICFCYGRCLEDCGQKLIQRSNEIYHERKHHDKNYDWVPYSNLFILQLHSFAELCRSLSEYSGDSQVLSFVKVAARYLKGTYFREYQFSRELIFARIYFRDLGDIRKIRENKFSRNFRNFVFSRNSRKFVLAKLTQNRLIAKFANIT